MNKYVVTLTEEEREMLQALASKGSHRSQKILNALVLLACDRGEFQSARSTNEDISRVLGVSMRKIDRVKKCFVERGLEIALNGTKGQRVNEKKADGDFEAHLVALSCSKPPKGFARWSLRLLAESCTTSIISPGPSAMVIPVEARALLKGFSPVRTTVTECDSLPASAIPTGRCAVASPCAMFAAIRIPSR